MKQILSLFTLLLCTWINILAQNEPTVSTCDGNQEICLTESTYDLCVELEVDQAFTFTIDSFLIDFDDGSPFRFVPGSNNPPQVQHLYDFSSFFNTDECSVEYTVRLYTYYTNNGQVIEVSTATFPEFFNPPNASFALNPQTTCVGEQVNFTNNSFPTCSLTSSWDYGDGTSGSDPFHTYDQTGNFIVTLNVSNTCGSSSSTEVVQIINPAEATIAIASNNINTTTTPFIYCLGSGDLQLDGDSLSANEDFYEWQSLNGVAGASWVLPPDAPNPNDPTPNIPDLAVSFSDTGFYQLILEVNNACDQPDFDTLSIQVLSSESLSNLTQPDACLALDYTPPGFNPNATYTINGVIQSSFPVTLSIGIYEVVCSLTNACGDQIQEDTFEVFGQVDVSILSPFPDTTLCLNSDSIMILYAPTGGTWTGPHLSFYGDSVFFHPVAVGDFTLTYTAGPGVGAACTDSESITITVIDPGVTIFDHEVCSTSAAFPMGATPTGGNYISTDCPTCIQNDTFIISEMVLLGLSSVAVTYNVTNASGCEGSNAFNVTIDDPDASFGVADTFCLGDPITIDLSNTNGNLTWMIDGQNSAPPPFLNLNPGQHTIKLTAAGGDCQVELTEDIFITAPPTDVSFTATPLEGCADLEVILTNTTSNFDNASFEWYINGALLSTLSDPGVIILESGLSDTTYTISLFAGNNCNGATFEQTITVFPRPVPRFGPMQNTYCSGDTVRFSNVSFGGPMSSWSWDYGNGITSNDSIPLEILYFTDTIPSIYTISLTATNDCGTEIFEYDLEIFPTDTKAFFNIDPLTGCTGTEICLTNLSTLGANVLWDFGDGNTSTVQNICHTYLEADTFTITLKAFGCGFDSVQQEVIIHPSPQANFTNNTIACPGDSIRFSNLTIGAEDFLWDFGDGNISTLNNPVHFYTTPGNYTVKLIATSTETCQDSISKTITILTPPVADFTIPSDSICVGQELNFTSATTTNILNCFWDFGDGNFSNACNANHAYENIGSFIVTLILADNNNCRDTTQRLVSVSPVPQPMFDFITDQDCSPILVSFNNTSILSESYEWDFGDGTTSALTNPTHTYSLGGNYTVRLTAINGHCSEIIEENLVINATPDANIITPLGQTGCSEFVAPFTSSPTGGSFRATWNFGDGINSFMADPTHTYTIPGIYEVSLIVEDTLSGCIDTAFTDIEIFEPLVANTVITDILCHGDTTGSIDLSINSGTEPFQYLWSNGMVTPDLSDLTAGEYVISITDNNNCHWFDTLIINQPTPITTAIIDRSIVTCYDGDDGSICIEVTGGIPDYLINWQIGEQEACIENVSAGDYPLEITDDNGCVENFIFQVDQNPQLEIIDEIGNISCFGANDGFINLDSIIGGASNFYNNTLTGPINYDGGNNFPDLVPGNYTLVVQDLEGCIIESTYLIGEPDSLWVMVPQDTVIGLGDSLWIETSHNAADPIFTWSPSATLDCNDCEDPIAKPLTTTTYYLNLSDRNDCPAKDTLTVVVDSNREFYIPNTFTPNGDGRNDFFRIRSRLPSIRRINAFRIFNRWGDMVFEAEGFKPQEENFDHAWDGSFRGQPLAPDQFTYYVEVEYLDQEIETVKGTVLLVR